MAGMFASVEAKRFLGFAKLLFELGLVLVFVYLCTIKWGDISAIVSGVDYRILLLVVLVLTLAHIAAPLAAKQILAMQGVHASYVFLFRIHVLRLPGKYIPGGIWHSVGRAMDMLDVGISKASVARLFFYENLFAVLVAASVGLLLHFSVIFEVFLCVMAFVFFGALASILFVCKTGPALRTKVSLIALCVAIYVVAWLCLATGFVLYLWSLIPFDVSEVAAVISSYLLAWVAGVLAIFAPQGMGVFEYVFSALLWGKDVSVSVLIVIGGYRILVFLVDVLFWLFFKLTLLCFRYGDNK